MTGSVRQPAFSRTPPARVCFIIDDLSRAGTEMQLLLLLRHLDRSKVEPHLCLLDGTSKSGRELRPDDVPVVALGICRLVSFRALRQAWRLRQYLIENRIDVVQTYFTDSTVFAAPVAKWAGVRSVLGSQRNIGHWVNERGASLVKVANRFFVDKIVVNCDAARRAVLDQDTARLNDIITIPNGIDLTRFKRFSPWKPGPSSTRPRIGMVGNLRDVKGPDVFIRAAKVVIGHFPGAVFEIAGAGDPTPYAALIAELGLGEKVRLMGQVSDILSFIGSLDLAILPSRAEGLSNALLEYMAAGRPIVATDVGGNSELIKTDENGLLVPSDSPGQLATAILNLVANPATAEKLAREAHRSAHQRYPIELAAERYCEVCAQMRSPGGDSGRPMSVAN